MLLSCRRGRYAVGASKSMNRTARAVAISLIVAPGMGFAADTYMVPKLEVFARADTNRELNTKAEGGADSSESYIGDAQLTLGVSTPRSDTYIRPRIRYQNSPDIDNAKRTEQFFDFKSDYKTERSAFDFLARYSKRDTLNAEFQDATFDPLTPDDPLVPETGTVVVGETQERIAVSPSFRHEWTERMGIGATATYQKVDFSSSSSVNDPKIGFDYVEGEGFLSRQLGLRTVGEMGVYASKFETDDNLRTNDAYGLTARLRKQWTPTFGLLASAVVERDDIKVEDVSGATIRDEKETQWGLEVTGDFAGQVSRTRFSVGRFISPTSAGSKSTVDQLRVQYDRSLTQRLEWTSAVRYNRQRAVGGQGLGLERDYVIGDLGLKYMLTPTWYVTGGYTYRWQDRKTDIGTADNHSFVLGFGYEGLRQRR